MPPTGAPGWSENDGACFLNYRPHPKQKTSITLVTNSSLHRRHQSCHLLCHSCARHMLENGEDVRFHPAVALGHARLDATNIYTEVGITRLKEVYARRHPHAQ